MEKKIKNQAREEFLSEDNYNNCDVSSGQYIESEEEIYNRLKENQDILVQGQTVRVGYRYWRNKHCYSFSHNIDDQIGSTTTKMVNRKLTLKEKVNFVIQSNLLEDNRIDLRKYHNMLGN